MNNKLSWVDILIEVVPMTLWFLLFNGAIILGLVLLWAISPVLGILGCLFAAKHYGIIS